MLYVKQTQRVCMVLGLSAMLGRGYCHVRNTLFRHKVLELVNYIQLTVCSNSVLESAKSLVLERLAFNVFAHCANCFCFIPEVRSSFLDLPLLSGLYIQHCVDCWPLIAD